MVIRWTEYRARVNVLSRCNLRRVNEKKNEKQKKKYETCRCNSVAPFVLSNAIEPCKSPCTVTEAIIFAMQLHSGIKCNLTTVVENSLFYSIALIRVSQSTYGERRVTPGSGAAARLDGNYLFARKKLTEVWGVVGAYQVFARHRPESASKLHSAHCTCTTLHGDAMRCGSMSPVPANYKFKSNLVLILHRHSQMLHLNTPPPPARYYQISVKSRRYTPRAGSSDRIWSHSEKSTELVRRMETCHSPPGD